jgi:hypothetical protein
MVNILFTKTTPADRDISELTKRLDEERIDYKLIDADSREGADLSELYDIVSRPAVVVTRSDGSIMQSWQGSLPPVADISYLAHS